MDKTERKKMDTHVETHKHLPRMHSQTRTHTHTKWMEKHETGGFVMMSQWKCYSNVCTQQWRIIWRKVRIERKKATDTLYIFSLVKKVTYNLQPLSQRNVHKLLFILHYNIIIIMLMNASAYLVSVALLHFLCVHCRFLLCLSLELTVLGACYQACV